MKIALEERKMLIAHRKLESMRLLEELFNRVKVNNKKNRFDFSSLILLVFLLGTNSSRRIK
jgi:hypothetical protein